MSGDEIRENVYGLIQDIRRDHFGFGDPSPLSDDLPIVSIGMSSDLAIDLLLGLEQRFVVEVPEHSLYACQTIGEIVALMRGLKPAEHAPITSP